MKKLLVALGVVFSVQFAYAQKSVYTELPDRLFTQGKEMFKDNNYVGSMNTLEEFKKKSKKNKLWSEADFMIVASMYKLGNENAAELLKEYLEEYPETYHRNQVCFYIGTTHFVEKDWDKTLYWFSQSDMDYLTPSEQEDFSYRAAYANLQVGSKDEAKRYFGLLSRNSKKYAEPASYYLAYINFQDGEYDKAIPTFRKLKGKQEYKENATFFLMQAAYLQGDLNETVSQGRDYLASYPNSANTAEVYRLLGNSYYRSGDTQNAINNYSQYVERTDSPFREDMYQLAEAYYRTNDFRNAVDALKNVASTSDLLGQAGYMLLGQSYLKVNETRNAIMAFDAAARAEFDRTISEEALYNYVMLMNQDGGSAFGQAITASQRFLTEYPNSKHTNEVNEVLATTLLSTKNYNTALTAINSIKSPGKQILDAKQVILFQIGVQEFIDGRYDKAAEHFNTTINMGDYNREARNESYFWRGETFYRKGDYRSAGRDYATFVGQASSRNKNYPLALYNLAYTNYQTGDYNSALNNFRKYVSAETNKQSPSYPDALNRIGDCFLYNRNFSQAESYYSQAANANPGNADYSEFQKAFVLGLQRNYGGKIAALNSMMNKYPNSQYYDDALFEKSRALIMQDKEREAIEVLEKLLKDFPKSNLAQKAGVQLGQSYFNLNNSQKSIAAYKQVINNYPNTDEARTAIQSLEGVYKDVNDIDSYAAYVNSLGKGTILSATRQDSLTYLAAENVYIKGNKAQSKGSFEKYLQAYPKGVFSSDAHYYLGSMAFDAKDFDSALSHFREVINSNNPKYIDDALIFASGIEFDRKNYQAAYAAYDHLSMVAANADNRNVGRLGMLRCAYLMKKDNEVVEAANKLLEDKKLSSDVSKEAHFYRGQSLKNLNQTDKAIADLQIVAKDTRSAFGAESQYLLADMYFQAKSYDKAESQVLSFMKEGTPHQYWMARAVIVLADVYAAKGDNFQARQYLESLQANYKGSETDIKDMISTRLSTLK
ncbi:tetratricopeptide repeat protein [Dysgonomonas sp. Marseille-P4361]|uniref:tetratricopeptide repeat protein n=1 Tax=Dysgonomonas sp. Marseille-P4361 TaxID=2161820 RepID=UPI000D559048|nr:tetratricopeptide repeat protein [Dysgonomonas sp. Marseille-P4361]